MIKFCRSLLAHSGRSKGFTLIEVLIAVVLVGMVLTAVAATLTNTVKNSAESRYRLQANDLAQTAIEFFSREKTLDGWGDFQNVFPSGSTTYCLVTLPGAGGLSNLITLTHTCSTSETIVESGVEFTRQATVTKTSGPPQTVSVVVVVKWVDGNLTPQVLLQRDFIQTN